MLIAEELNTLTFPDQDTRDLVKQNSLRKISNVAVYTCSTKDSFKNFAKVLLESLLSEFC